MARKREPTTAHAKIADVATGAARMHRDVHADDGMKLRIMRAVACKWPHVRLSPAINGAKLERLAAHIAAEVWARARPRETINAGDLMRAGNKVRDMIATTITE
jgi:hypothetical protein